MQLDVSPAPGSILEIGESLELAPEELEPYGDYAVKVDPAAIERCMTSTTVGLCASQR
jgi:formyltetrahydrofolate synthetase